MTSNTTIAAAARAFRNGQQSSLNVTRNCLERIKLHNPSMHSFSLILEEQALAQAAKADDDLHNDSDRGMLHGIPVAIKDNIDMEGLPTLCGSPVRKDHIARADAEVVRRLANAGAIIVGKTNLIEFGFLETHPDLERTNNPWNLSRSSGGSSGGSAAAVAAGHCFAALGTDTAGSIRLPASWCGISGLKPTFGQVPVGGVFPSSKTLDVVGPMARSCGDLRAILAALLGDSVRHDAARLDGLKIGVLHSPAIALKVSADVGAVFDNACRDLEASGAILQPCSIRGFDLGNATNFTIVASEASRVLNDVIAARLVNCGPATKMGVALGEGISSTTYLTAMNFRDFLKARINDALEKFDVLISPSVPIVAPDKDPSTSGVIDFIESVFSAPFAVSGLPALTIPCGLTFERMPVGMQIAGRAFSDQNLLQLGEACEKLWPMKWPFEESPVS